MHVLMITREYPPFQVGGISTHTYHLARNLRKLGVKTTVLSYGDPNHSDEETIFIEPNSSVISKSDAGISNDIKIPLDIAKLTRKAKQLLETREYDLVHVQEPYVAGLTVYSDRKITTIHDTSYGELKGIIHHPLTKHNIKRALFFITIGYLMEFASIANSKYIITPSPQVKQELEKIYKANPRTLRMIPNGVEPPSPDEPAREEAREKLGLPQDKTIIFTVSQHVARKRLDILIEAAKILRDKQVGNIQVIIGGKGPLTPVLENMVHQYNLENLVKLVGWIPGSLLPTYYRAADIFVVTSDYEAGPITLLEAGIRGLALVSTRINGFPALMKNGHDGILYPPGNPWKLAEALEKLVENEDHRRRLGRNAVKFASKYTWRKIAQLTRQVYLETLQK